MAEEKPVGSILETAQSLSDIELIFAVAAGLTRKRDSIYLLLTEIYSVGRSWLKGGRDQARETRDAAIQSLGIRVDRRAKRNVFRFLIEVGCRAVDKKLRPRYANALRYAYSHDCPPKNLITFLKSRGGIEQCAKRFLMRKRKEIPRARTKVHLKRPTRW
jgi:hypothetical protein